MMFYLLLSVVLSSGIEPGTTTQVPTTLAATTQVVTSACNDPCPEGYFKDSDTDTMCIRDGWSGYCSLCGKDLYHGGSWVMDPCSFFDQITTASIDDSDIVVVYFSEKAYCDLENRISEKEVDNGHPDITWSTGDVNVAKAKCVEITACNYVQEHGGTGLGNFYLCSGSVPTNTDDATQPTQTDGARGTTATPDSYCYMEGDFGHRCGESVNGSDKPVICGLERCCSSSGWCGRSSNHCTSENSIYSNAECPVYPSTTTTTIPNCECIPCGQDTPFNYGSGKCGIPTETCNSITPGAGCYSSSSTYECDCQTLQLIIPDTPEENVCWSSYGEDGYGCQDGDSRISQVTNQATVFDCKILCESTEGCNYITFFDTATTKYCRLMRQCANLQRTSTQPSTSYKLGDCDKTSTPTTSSPTAEPTAEPSNTLIPTAEPTTSMVSEDDGCEAFPSAVFSGKRTSSCGDFTNQIGFVYDFENAIQVWACCGSNYELCAPNGVHTGYSTKEEAEAACLATEDEERHETTEEMHETTQEPTGCPEIWDSSRYTWTSECGCVTGSDGCYTCKDEYYCAVCYSGYTMLNAGQYSSRCIADVDGDLEGHFIMGSEGKCPQGTELTEEECENLPDPEDMGRFGSPFGKWAHADTFPTTCGCYKNNGNRYFNRLTGACDEWGDRDYMICKEQSQIENQDCVLGDSLDPETQCTEECELLNQEVTTPASGTGTCSPDVHQCVHGEGACVISCIGPSIEDINDPEKFYEGVQDIIDDAWQKVLDHLPFEESELTKKKPVLLKMLATEECYICHSCGPRCLMDDFEKEHCIEEDECAVIVPSWPDIQRRQPALDVIQAWARWGGVSDEEAYLAYIGKFVPLHEVGHHLLQSHPDSEFPMPSRLPQWYDETHGNSFGVVYWNDMQNADPACEADYTMMRDIFTNVAAVPDVDFTPEGQYAEIYFNDVYGDMPMHHYGWYQTVMINNLFVLVDDLEVSGTYMEEYLNNGMTFPAWTAHNLLMTNPFEECPGADDRCVATCPDPQELELTCEEVYDMFDGGCGDSCDDCVKKFYQEISCEVCEVGEAYESTGCQSDGGDCDGVFFESAGMCAYCYRGTHTIITEEDLAGQSDAVWCALDPAELVSSLCPDYMSLVEQAVVEFNDDLTCGQFNDMCELNRINCTRALQQQMANTDCCAMNADCELGAALDPSTQCTDACELLTQSIMAPATGSGMCSPAAHQCVHGEGSCITTTGGAYTCGSTMEECEAAYLAASTPAISVMEPTMTLDGCDELDSSWVNNVVNGLSGWDSDSMKLCANNGQYAVEVDGMVYPTCVAYGTQGTACTDDSLVCPDRNADPGVFGYAGNVRNALSSSMTRADFGHPQCPTATCLTMDSVAESNRYWKDQVLNQPFTEVTEAQVDALCVNEDNQVMFVTREGKCNTCIGWSTDATAQCESGKFLCAGHSGEGEFTYGWPGQIARTLAVAAVNADGMYMHPQCPLMICKA